MSATWDDKGTKANPVAADEVLIIDTEDSRNQKRATLSTLGFGIDSINSLTASAQFIAGGTGIDVVSITDTHTISVDSTVAKIDLANIFTEPNTFTADVLIEKDDGTAADYNATAFNDDPFRGSFFTGSKARNTKSSPQALQLDDIISGVQALGFDGNAFNFGGVAEFVADGTWTVSSFPTRYDISTISINSTTLTKRLEVGSTSLLTGFETSDTLTDSFQVRLQKQQATGDIVDNNDSLGKLTFFGADATGPVTFTEGGRLEFFATETWADTDHGTRFEIHTTANGANLPSLQLTIEQDGTADFHGNIITNAIFDVELNNGFIQVGDQNNSQEDYSAQLETKAECLAATTTNITLANSQTIDGIAVVNPNRVLVKNQTVASENGIYEVVDAGAWTRTTDANTSGLVNNGMFTKITFGTVNANTAWVLSTPDPIILDTTDLTIDQFSLADIAHLNSTQTFTGSNSFASDLLLQHPDGDEIDIVGTVFSNSPGDRSEFTGRRARGTPSTPLAVLDGDSLSGWEGIGFDGTQFTSGFSAAILIKADGDWTDAPNRPTRIELRTTLPNGSNVDPRLVVNSLGQTSFEDNPIINIGSILLNDDDDSNSYTILGGSLTGDFNVTRKNLQMRIYR